jgi:hypothetical protein
MANDVVASIQRDVRREAKRRSALAFRLLNTPGLVSHPTLSPLVAHAENRRRADYCCCGRPIRQAAACTSGNHPSSACPWLWGLIARLVASEPSVGQE